MRTLTAAHVFLTLLMAWSTFGQTYTITTLAGNGTSGFSGDNGPATSAELSYPSGVAADSAGNLYIADENNYRIRKVSKGVITTVAGNGTRGFSGDGQTPEPSPPRKDRPQGGAETRLLRLWRAPLHRLSSCERQ